MKILNCRVIEHQPVSEKVFFTTVEAAEIATEARPGQFVYIQIRHCIDPLLRRAYSIARIDKTKGSISILYKVIGKGTLDFSGVNVGDQINVMGPLGNPFSWEESFDEALLVGGGIGVAPFPFLDEVLTIKGVKSTFLMGARTKAEMYFDRIFDKDRLHVSTDDGTIGAKGFVIDLLKEYLKNINHRVKIFACGPDRMLRSVAEFAVQNKMMCELSMETTMACGVGVCQGCAILTWNADHEKSYRLCCSDGPIFKAEEVRWVD